MLRIFYGRENLNKDKFLYDSIEGKTMILVPDQFTLQAERDAFFYLQTKGLMDVEVVSFSRLGTKILAETGGGNTSMINKYGRHMLLAKILKEHGQELELYRGMERKQSFIEMVNNFISELKQYGADPQQLEAIAEELEKEAFLKRKLTDVQKIFAYYEEAIQGKYLDTEDLVNLYAGKIAQSEKVKTSNVWIYGFDTFTPKNLQVIEELIKTAKSVNIVMAGSTPGRDSELFQLSGYLMGKLGAVAEEIPDTYRIEDKAKGILALEQELYAIPVESQENSEGITLVQAANFYNEAETAAVKVLELVRDQRMKYNDIVLICNDLETRGTITKRVFQQYGIQLFLDKKQGVLHNPVCVFLLSLLELAEGDYSTEVIFRLLKTDLTDMEWEMAERLENYARKYRIQGRRWTKPFRKGAHEYDPAELEALELARASAIDRIETFARAFGKAITVKEKVQVLYQHLVEVCRIPEKLEELITQQEDSGFLTAAAENAQVWGLLMDVLDQFVEIIGEETILAENFADILRTGMEAIEVGLLPPSADGLIMGTMQRTRTSHVKAMLILGANEGLLPAVTQSDSLLNEDEKLFLTEQKIEICKVDTIRQQEEKIAIYKNFSRPSQQLWISYSVSDEEGRELKASQLVTKLKEIFPELPEQPDLANSGNPKELLQAEDAGKDHLTAALRRMASGEKLDPAWQLALEWYAENNDLGKLKEGLFFTGEQQDIARDFIYKLYKTDFDKLIMSPSKLEKYSRCPFSYFVQYGLRPDEQRTFEIGGREIGDMYHHCFMELCRWLNEDGEEIQAKTSRWNTITREACLEKVSQILDQEMEQYRDGVMGSGKEEIYRSGRLKEICGEVSWVLIEHVCRGSIRKMELEAEFGRHGQLPPITVDTDLGQVLIEGKIDRIDTLDDDRIKIIDYKTGNEQFSTDEARKGYRLQLMLYLRAALEGKHKPAGVFYFLVNEPNFSAMDIQDEDLQKAIQEKINKSYKMNGTMIDDPAVIEAIAGEFDGYSDIVQLRNTKSGVKGLSSDRLLMEDEFEQFRNDVDEKIRSICGNLLAGKNPARPMKNNKVDTCQYCGFKGICQFDFSFEGCKSEQV